MPLQRRCCPRLLHLSRSGRQATPNPITKLGDTIKPGHSFERPLKGGMKKQLSIWESCTHPAEAVWRRTPPKALFSQLCGVWCLNGKLGLSGYPADGRRLPDAHGPALHRADRDALCVGGQERRRFVEAQEEAEEAHGFERQSKEGSIILSHDPPIKSAARRLTYNGVVSKLEASTASLLF